MGAQAGEALLKQTHKPPLIPGKRRWIFRAFNHGFGDQTLHQAADMNVHPHHIGIGQPQLHQVFQPFQGILNKVQQLVRVEDGQVIHDVFQAEIFEQALVELFQLLRRKIW